ncbi:hypothetical protein AVEN_100351-1 [Araneus ventricosus]|uniref:Uncharacterized protein n=1 Tax=Araneus ventricosus TaxID=182803 RepID=A0A4Y2KP44_ARAVE|nr:hypothetical protein AVEN_100351-1 [Araneus ventricosus]
MLQLCSGKTAIICTTTEAHTSPMWIGLCCLHSLLSVWVSVWSDGNEGGTHIYTWMNSVRAELYLFSILHGRIKFHLPPHGKVRDENTKESSLPRLSRILTNFEEYSVGMVVIAKITGQMAQPPSLYADDSTLEYGELLMLVAPTEASEDGEDGIRALLHLPE